MKPTAVLKFLAPLLLTLALFTTSQTAQAQEPLAKFIERFNNVSVEFGPKSDDCGIRDKQRYAATVTQGLTQAGLASDRAAITSAYLFVWGVNFGPLDQQCAIYVSLRLGADVPGKVVSVLPNDDSVFQRMKTVEGTFAGTFWTSSILFVHVSGFTEDAVNDNVVELTKEFATAHAK
ncbi:MAG TPA: hypothetical protein VGO34_15140 [Alphaproteobacteria bacterium]